MISPDQLQLGFAGTPQFAADILQRLLDSGYQPKLVMTQPDRPTGRGRKLIASPVKSLAQRHGLPLIQPPGLKNEQLPVALDVLVVAAYGLILPAHILDAPRHGCLNVHASLLPRWRGAAPVERAIMAGDTATGVTIMQMDEGLDTGPTYCHREIPITPDTTGETLASQLAQLGATALIEVLGQLGSQQPEPQQGEASYAAKLSAADAEIDFSRSANELHNQVRALSGRMPATCTKSDVRVRMLASEVVTGATDHQPGEIVSANKRGILIACAEDALLVTQLQINRGKGRPMNAAAAINGYAELFSPGTRFDARSG